MKLNHLNLVVPDVARAAALFTEHFDFRPQPGPGAALAILHGPDDFVLVLMPPKGSEQAIYPGAFHLGFGYATPEQVKAKHAQLSTAGLAVEREPRAMHGSFTFYVRVLDFLLIEVGCPLPAVA